MPDAPHDLRDYLFDELTAAERSDVEDYLSTCAEARAELEQLRLTHAALLQLPELEIPQRIAFVSDPVLEPSAWQRFWREFLGGAPRFAMGMAAVMVVFFAGAWATEPSLSQTESGWSLAFGGTALPVAAGVSEAGVSEAEVLAAVREAVAASEARQLEAIAASEGVDEQWVAARIAEVRRELAEVQEDAVMGYELVNTKHETFKRQMFQMDLASLRGL
jgi:hypothetical protein